MKSLYYVIAFFSMSIILTNANKQTRENISISFILKLIPDSMNLTQSQKFLFAQNVFNSFLKEKSRTTTTTKQEENIFKMTTTMVEESNVNTNNLRLNSEQNNNFVKAFNFMRFK
jgi:hypothetical protein